MSLGKSAWFFFCLAQVFLEGDAGAIISYEEPPTAAQTKAPAEAEQKVTMMFSATTSYRLRWKEPRDNGSPVAKYHLTYWKTRETSSTSRQRLTLPSSVTFYMFSDLELETQYSYQLIGENRFGFGVPAESTFCTGSKVSLSYPVGRVCVITVVEQAATVIAFSFSLCDSKIEVQSFEARFLKSGDETWQNFTWPEINGAGIYDLSGLQPDSQYTVKIYARNQFGVGAHSGSQTVNTLKVGAPRAPSILPTEKFYYRLHWKAPENEPVSDYAVAYWKDGDTSDTREGPWVQSANLGRREYFDWNGLESNCTYYVSIRARSATNLISQYNFTLITGYG